MDIDKRLIQVNAIGCVAYELLEQITKAKVFNQISRGIFIQLGQQQLAFISQEKFHGPLTINITSDQFSASVFTQGDQIDVQEDELRFVAAKVSLSMRYAEIWFPPAIAGSMHADQERRALIRDLADEAILQIPPGRESIFHSVLHGFSKTKANHGLQASEVDQRVEILKRQLQQGEFASIAQNLQQYLGLGSGLTPSGDDFVLGFLLSLNRWPSKHYPESFIKALNESITRAAYQHTTTLSANLIECACSGLVDERLIAAVDFLATGEASLADVLKGILSWGSSSGVDALIGMMTALEP